MRNSREEKDFLKKTYDEWQKHARRTGRTMGMTYLDLKWFFRDFVRAFKRAGFTPGAMPPYYSEAWDVIDPLSTREEAEEDIRKEFPLITFEEEEAEALEEQYMRNHFLCYYIMCRIAGETISEDVGEVSSAPQMFSLKTMAPVRFSLKRLCKA